MGQNRRPKAKHLQQVTAKAKVRKELSPQSQMLTHHPAMEKAKAKKGQQRAHLLQNRRPMLQPATAKAKVRRERPLRTHHQNRRPMHRPPKAKAKGKRKQQPNQKLK